MLRKKDRTLDHYIVVGAELKMLRAMIWRTYTDAHRVTPHNIRQKYERMEELVDYLRDRTEELMLKDFPDLKDYTHIFYGDLKNISTSVEMESASQLIAILDEEFPWHRGGIDDR